MDFKIKFVFLVLYQQLSRKVWESTRWTSHLFFHLSINRKYNLKSISTYFITRKKTAVQKKKEFLVYFINFSWNNLSDIEIVKSRPFLLYFTESKNKLALQKKRRHYILNNQFLISYLVFCINFKGQLISKMSFRCHRLDQNTNEKFDKFLP